MRKAATLNGYEVEKRSFVLDGHGLIFKAMPLTFDEYYSRLAPEITTEINCPARCWLRAMDANRAEELGI